MNQPAAQNVAIDSSQIPFDSLESIRHRLNQVHLSLRKLADQTNHNRYTGKVKLPTYASFQNQLGVLITQLNSILANLSSNVDVLKLTNVFPTPTFPTTQQEGLVTTLLRKKVLPEVEEWISEAEKSEMVDNEEFAQWCQSKVMELRGEFQFYGFHTVEELDYMTTEEGKKEAEEKLEAENRELQLEEQITKGKSTMSSNKVMKFMYQGTLS